MKLKKGSTIQGMGMYLIAIILAVLSVMIIIYLTSGLINKTTSSFKELLRALFPFL